MYARLHFLTTYVSLFDPWGHSHTSLLTPRVDRLPGLSGPQNSTDAEHKSESESKLSPGPDIEPEPERFQPRTLVPRGS